MTNANKLRNLIRAAALMLSVVAASTIFAQGQRVGSCGCGTPAQLPITWDIRHVNATFQQAAQASLALWNNYVDVHRANIGSSVDFDLGNGRNEILFFDFSEVEGLDPDTVGIMLSLPSEAFGNFNACPAPPSVTCGMPFMEMDVLIGDQIQWHTNRPNIDDPRDAGYYHSTAVHEIGHALGFHHNFKNVSTMNYYQDFAGQFVTRADVLAARTQFGSRAKQVVDLATYPFSYNADSQTGSGGTRAVKVANINRTSVAAGDKITIKNWTVENLSSSSVSQVFLHFFLSTDTTITRSDISLGGFKWEPLTTWSEDYEGFDFAIPANTPAGQYYVGALISYTSSFTADSLTYNNSWVIPTKLTVGSTTGGGTCVPSATNVCIGNDRFGVKVVYRAHDGKSGEGQMIEYTPNSALSWFFSSDNIEMLMKMVDACVPTFGNKYWFFAAATTDVEYTITVTDYRTGRVKTYFHGPGTPAPAITDTNAFDCN